MRIPTRIVFRNISENNSLFLFRFFNEKKQTLVCLDIQEYNSGVIQSNQSKTMKTITKIKPLLNNTNTKEEKTTQPITYYLARRICRFKIIRFDINKTYSF